MGSGLFGSHTKGALGRRALYCLRIGWTGLGGAVSLESARPQMSKHPTEARKCGYYDSVAYPSAFSFQGVPRQRPSVPDRSCSGAH